MAIADDQTISNDHAYSAKIIFALWLLGVREFGHP